MHRASAIALAGALLARPAGAEPAGLVLLCGDDEIGPGATCASLVAAVEHEMEGLDVQVLPGEGAGQTVDVPGPILEATASGEASCGAWIAPSPAGPALELYTPGSVQPRTAIAFAIDAQGAIDVADAAFRLRAIVAAALFLDLPGIEDGVQEPPPAEAPAPEPPPEPPVAEPAAPVEKEAGARYMGWMRIEAGYDLVGFPTEKHWYHGMGLAVGVALVAGLELFVDGVVTAPLELNLGTTASGRPVRIENAQYLVGLGLGYAFGLGDRVRLVPRLGLHLGISDSLVSAVTIGNYTRVNTAIWGGVHVRVVLVSFLSLTAGCSVENLFNFEYFEMVENMTTRPLFSLAQLRLGVFAGLTASF